MSNEVWFITASRKAVVKSLLSVGLMSGAWFGKYSTDTVLASGGMEAPENE